jgi:hypothetical protein
MADTKTSEVLSTEAGEQKDLGLYSQGKLKLNYDEEAGIWKQEYEAVKPSKMFIPPPPKEVKLPTDISMPTLPFEPSLPGEISQPAEPIVPQRDRGESLIEKQQREKEERFGPGQDPMTFSKTMSNIFTPGTEQFNYYDTRNILKQEGNQLTVNFDMIDEAGGYGLPSIAGGLLKAGEKSIIQSTITNLTNAGIIEGAEIDKAEGMYTFTVNQDKMNKYTENVSSLANKITGGRGPNGEYIPPNEYLLDELGKLGKEEATKFISEMAIASDNDQLKTIIDRAVNFGDKGAAAALLTFQQGDEPLDLDAKGFLGFDKYNDAFKEAYTKTLNELKDSQGEAPSASQSEGRPTLEERRAKTKRVDNLNREEKDKLLDELDTLLKQKEDERSKSSQGLTSPQKEALAGSTSKSSGGGTLGTPPSGGTSKSGGTPKKGTGASGPPGFTPKKSKTPTGVRRPGR